MINNLRILNLRKGATPKEIKGAYRELVKKWHPDLFYQDYRLRQRAEAKLKQINKAYNQLLANNCADPINEQSEHIRNKRHTKYLKIKEYFNIFFRLLQNKIYLKKIIHIVGYTLLLGSIFSICFLGLMLLWLVCLIIVILMF